MPFNFSQFINLSCLFPLLTFLPFHHQDMFSEELQAVPVELEEIDVTESSRLTEDH